GGAVSRIAQLHRSRSIHGAAGGCSVRFQRGLVGRTDLSEFEVAAETHLEVTEADGHRALELLAFFDHFQAFESGGALGNKLRIGEVAEHFILRSSDSGGTFYVHGTPLNTFLDKPSMRIANSAFGRIKANCFL